MKWGAMRARVDQDGLLLGRDDSCAPLAMFEGSRRAATTESVEYRAEIDDRYAPNRETSRRARPPVTGS